jgi:hypothetical protein
MIRWRTRRLRRKRQDPPPIAEHQKQLWLAGAPLEGPLADLYADLSRALMKSSAAQSGQHKREVLEDMGFSLTRKRFFG